MSSCDSHHLSTNFKCPNAVTHIVCCDGKRQELGVWGHEPIILSMEGNGLRKWGVAHFVNIPLWFLIIWCSTPLTTLIVCSKF